MLPFTEDVCVTWLLLLERCLCGFHLLTSRWMCLFWCRYCSPLAAPAPIERLLSHERAGAPSAQASRSSRDPPDISSYTRHRCCPSLEKPTILTRFSCFRLTHNSKNQQHIYDERFCCFLRRLVFSVKDSCISSDLQKLLKQKTVLLYF